jgi:hypothetical protein
MNAHQIIIALECLGLLLSGAILAIILWYRPKIDRHLQQKLPLQSGHEELRNAIEDAAIETAAIVREEGESVRVAIDGVTEANRLDHREMSTQLRTVSGRAQWLVANSLSEKLDEIKKEKGDVPNTPSQPQPTEDSDHG